MHYRRFTYTFLIMIWAALPCIGQQKMLIIHPPCFKTAADSLVWQKEAAGIKCITWECTLSQPALIKLCIDSITQRFPANYMLILGDFEHIPSYENMEWLSDIYYATDSAGHARMAIGRLSAQNAEELQYMIQKNATDSYLQNIVAIASSSVSALTGKTDIQRVQDLLGYIQAKGIPDTHIYYSTPEYTLQASDIIQAVNNGTQLLIYAGHGDYTGWNTGNFTTHDIDNIHNTLYPVIISAACLNGHYARRTCMAEAWMRSPHGAKAVIMSSALCDHDANMEALLYSIQLPDMPATLGEWWLLMYNYTTFTLHRPNDAQAWILFGDPSMPISLPHNEYINDNNIDSLLLYPNPAHNTLHINTLQHTDIYNINGTLIQRCQGPDIDVSALTAGTYVLKTDNRYFLFIKQ